MTSWPIWEARRRAHILLTAATIMAITSQVIAGGQRALSSARIGGFLDIRAESGEQSIASLLGTIPP